MLSLFARSVSHEANPEPWKPWSYQRFQSRLVSPEASVEFIYGITPCLALTIAKIIRLSEYLVFYAFETIPETLAATCEELGDELSKYSVDSEEFSCIEANDGLMASIARAQATAFYNSALIYYYRSIQKCDRQDLRDEQRKALDAMQLAEDLKIASLSGDRWAAPISWPAFIASCEAPGELRGQWATWWIRVQSYGVSNYHKQWTVIQTLWAYMDAQGSSDWRRILSDLHIRIIPV